MPILDRKSSAVCNVCGSHDVNCRASYSSSGADMEHVEHIHRCLECGASESSMQSGTYGYDHEYTCGMRHLEDADWGQSGRFRVLRRDGEKSKFVVWSGVSRQHAELRRDQMGAGADILIEPM